MTCSDSLMQYFFLEFTCVIDDPKQILRYEPLLANFDSVNVGEKKEITLSLTNTDSTASEIKIIEEPDKDKIKTQIKSAKLGPGESTKLTFELSKKIEAGPLLSGITLEVKDKLSSRITIPISATVLGDSAEEHPAGK